MCGQPKHGTFLLIGEREDRLRREVISRPFVTELKFRPAQIAEGEPLNSAAILMR